MSVGARFAGGDLGDTPASPSASTPRRARPLPTGGVFGYWFGPPHPRADTSAVFTELVRRIRAGRYKLTPQETAALRRCESDLQVRAITSGYVAGAVTHAALGAVRAPAAPRWAAAFSAGIVGAYAGAQTIARECLRALVHLPDSPLGGECRAIVARLAPGDPLGEAPAATPGKPATAWRRNETRRPAETRANEPANATTARGGAEARAARDEVRRSVDESDADRVVRRERIVDTNRRERIVDATRDDSETARDVAFDGASSSRSEYESTRDDSYSYRRRVDSRVRRARGGGTKGARLSDDGDGAFGASRGGGGFAVVGFRVSGRDAWGMEREDEPSPVAARGDRTPRARRRETERRAAIARKGAEARRRRGGDGFAASAEGTGANEFPDKSPNASRDELRDPAGRLGGFGERGTRRNAYGDVLDR